MKGTVPPEGPLSCQIALVGEAPGAEEERFGRPFIGMSGELLDRLLRLAGIIRSSCYVTNVVKERPSHNDISTFIDFAKHPPKRTPEYDAYEAQLFEELQGCSANIFVALGKTALYALTGYTDITKRRGSLLRCHIPGLEDRKVLGTVHPAAALRQYTHTYLISYDLKKARENSTIKGLVLPERNLLVRPSFFEAMSFVKECGRYPEVAFDIEVSMQTKHISCISLAPSPDIAMSIPFLAGGGDYFDPPQEAELWLAIAQLLENPDVVKVGHNILFDAYFMFHYFGIRVGPMEDTMVATGIAYPDFPKGLDFITSILTDEPYYKDDGKFIMKGLRSGDEDFWRYNAKDSAVCLECWHALRPILEKMGNWSTYKRQAGIIPSLLYMQARGIKVATEQMEASRKQAEERIDELYAKLLEEVGPDKSRKFARSSKQLKEYFYGTLGHSPYYNKGKVTVDDMALKRLSRKGVKAAAIIREIRKYSKLKDTYFEMKVDSDGRLRTSYNPVGTESGRLSSGQSLLGGGGNFQNMPKQFKVLLVADEGKVLLEFDLSQAENRCVAALGPDKAMMFAFNNGVDIHRHTFGLMFGKKAEEVSDEPFSCPFGDGSKSERAWGKMFNHALNYGMGARTFALRVEIGEPDAKRLIDRYHQIYPGVRHGYQFGIQEQLKRDRCIRNPYGRVRKFYDRWGDELFKVAYATMAQSIVADKINQNGLLEVWENPAFPEVELVNQVHDSICIQVPLAAGWARIAEIVAAVVASLEEAVPHKEPFVIPAEVKMGLSLGEMKGLPKPYQPDMLERVYTQLTGEKDE